MCVQSAPGMRAQGIAAAEVEIMGSCLYLRGRASCYRMKATAGVAVAGVARGFEVINELRVAHETDSDPGVIKAVQDSIRRAVPGAAARIAVISNDGDVFLRGRSTDDSERARIEVAAWEAPGVMHVHNEIEVPHEPTSDDEYARDLSATSVVWSRCEMETCAYDTRAASSRWRAPCRAVSSSTRLKNLWAGTRE